jgi:hypothetical protein
MANQYGRSEKASQRVKSAMANQSLKSATVRGGDMAEQGACFSCVCPKRNAQANRNAAPAKALFQSRVTPSDVPMKPVRAEHQHDYAIQRDTPQSMGESTPGGLGKGSTFHKSDTGSLKQHCKQDNMVYGGAMERTMGNESAMECVKCNEGANGPATCNEGANGRANCNEGAMERDFLFSTDSTPIGRGYQSLVDKIQDLDLL